MVIGSCMRRTPGADLGDLLGGRFLLLACRLGHAVRILGIATSDSCDGDQVAGWGAGSGTNTRSR